MLPLKAACAAVRKAEHRHPDSQGLLRHGNRSRLTYTKFPSLPLRHPPSVQQADLVTSLTT